MVIRGISRCRAVATRIWSAGSRWNGGGSRVDSMAISGERGMSRMAGRLSAREIHSATSIVSFSRSRSTSLATSQTEIALTSRLPFGAEFSCVANSAERSELPVTHHIQMENHAEAIQSDGSTVGASGSTNATTLPRRRSDIGFGAVATRGRTITSTASPT